MISLKQKRSTNRTGDKIARNSNKATIASSSRLSMRTRTMTMRNSGFVAVAVNVGTVRITPN